MKLFPAIALFFSVLLPWSVAAQSERPQVISQSDVIPGAPVGVAEYDFTAETATGTNLIVLAEDGSASLMADSLTLHYKTSDVEADGHVRVQARDMIWVGDHINFNFKTGEMRSEQFRTGKFPVFAGGEGLSGNISNRLHAAHTGGGITNQLGVYTATNAFVTTDDFADPAYKIRASRIKVIPGKSVQMWNAVAYLGGVPVFYFPYYERNLGTRANNFTTTPGYRSRYGTYLLNTYNWYFGDVADGKIHGDYRALRGPGAGPDVKLHLGQWGEASLRYYYQNDSRANAYNPTNVLPQLGSFHVPANRQRFYLGWQATPSTNLNLKALVNYQSDPLFLHDFIEGDYTHNPQPNTFVEANRYWDNWSLDALTTPRVNSFFNQVERLPDVKLTGFRQQLGDSPVYYDSESSVGYYRAFETYTNGLYAGTNGFYANSAARADTYHQLTLPWTFFNWLNITPRVGGRLTYYSSQNRTNGAPNDDVTREVFNTGVGASFKASQLWPEATNSFLQVDGLRHIMEPSANYVFVPRPSTPLAQLPQFDGEIPSLMLAPVLFPDYNSIDAIDAMNVVRFGLRNVLQTKRDGQLQDLVNWNMLLDWRLDPTAGQSTLNDLYSQLAFRPRTWLTAESQLRYDLDRGDLNLAFHQLTFAPNNRWSWGIGHWYMRNGFLYNVENDYLTSTLFYRVNDNWGVRATHNFNSRSGRLQEQFYTLYRDLRSWTGGLTFRLTDNVGSQQDFTVGFALSLKASPVQSVGDDSVDRYHLLGQ